MAKVLQIKSTSVVPVQFVRKEYKNEYGEEGSPDYINLNFKLRDDITDELVIFLELLKRAMVQVEDDIKKIRANRKSKSR